VQRDGHDGHDAREHEQGVAPAVRDNERVGERREDKAR
jgi:hypothetical protein